MHKHELSGRCDAQTDDAVARQLRELSVQPPLVATCVAAGSHLGQPRARAHGKPLSAPLAFAPDWGAGEGGDAMRDAQADVPSA